jgi:hypothetical protein
VRVWDGDGQEAPVKRVDVPVPVKPEVVFDREAFRAVDMEELGDESSVDLDDNDDLLEEERALLEEEDEQVEVRKPLKISVSLSGKNK